MANLLERMACLIRSTREEQGILADDDTPQSGVGRGEMAMEEAILVHQPEVEATG